MPYNPGISYHGDQYIYGGLQNLGQGIGTAISETIKERDKAQEELAADQTILGFAKQQGLVTPEIEQQYLTGNQKQKAGIIAGLTRGFAMNMQQQQMQALQEQRLAQAELRKQQAGVAEAMAAQRKAAAPFANTPLWATDASGKPFQAGIYDPSGDPKLFNQAVVQTQTGARSPNVVEYTDEKGVTHTIQANTKLGQDIIRSQNPNLIPAKPPTEAQIKSAFSTFDVTASDIANSDKQHPIDAQGNDVEAGQPFTAYRIDTDKGNRIIPVDSFNHLKSLVTSSSPEEKSNAPDLGQAAAIKAAFQSGKISRDEAKKQLQSIGFK